MAESRLTTTLIEQIYTIFCWLILHYCSILEARISNVINTVGKNKVLYRKFLLSRWPTRWIHRLLLRGILGSVSRPTQNKWFSFIITLPCQLTKDKQFLPCLQRLFFIPLTPKLTRWQRTYNVPFHYPFNFLVTLWNNAVGGVDHRTLTRQRRREPSRNSYGETLN